MDVKDMVSTALAGIVATGLSLASSEAMAAKVEMEKCYGIVKASKNDCGAPSHACAGEAKRDNDPNEWIFLPKGSCDKITGGSTEPGE